jgi:predicted dehydrogenase
VLSSHFRVHQPWGDLWAGNPPAGFAHTPPGGSSEIVRRYGGGILVCGGSHILDLVCFLLGRPARLAASLHVPADRDYDLRACALLETPQGPAHFEALAHPLRRIGFLRDGWEEWIQITGTEGRLDIYSPLWDDPDHKGSLLVHYDNAAGTSTEHRFPPVSPFALAVEHFCAQIARGEQGPQPRRTGYDVDELIAHVRRSAESGRRLEVAYRIG